MMLKNRKKPVRYRYDSGFVIGKVTDLLTFKEIIWHEWYTL